MKAHQIAIVVLGSAILGFVLGRRSISERAVPQSTPTVDPRAVKVECPPVPTDPQCEARLRILEDSLSLSNGIVDAYIKATVGTPEPFPTDLPPQYSADGFEEEVLAALQECPEASISLAYVDCSEFPCMAFFSQPNGTHNHGVGSLSSCDAWRDRFESGGQANSEFMTDRGVVEYSVAVPRPLGSDFDENAKLRWDLRQEQGREHLMDLWGGREPTKIEELDQQIEFWRKAAYGSQGESDNIKAIIQDLESRRARLTEEEGGADP